jgi:hypothetical protein
MARHLATCAQRQAAQAEADKTKRPSQTLYHLQVKDAWNSDFWLQLEMRGSATLKDLDAYLRAIWLECCGHLSQFTIGPWRYTQIDAAWREPDDRSMKVKIETIFVPGLEIPYEYDFGTTSELRIKVVAQRAGKPTTEHPIVLMARNQFEPPPCIACGKPATHICPECMDQRADERGELCDEHAEEHEHEDMLMALVNSPRTGMCGYDGPAVPPY